MSKQVTIDRDVLIKAEAFLRANYAFETSDAIRKALRPHPSFPLQTKHGYLDLARVVIESRDVVMLRFFQNEVTADVIPNLIEWLQAHYDEWKRQNPDEDSGQNGGDASTAGGTTGGGGGAGGGSLRHLGGGGGGGVHPRREDGEAGQG